MISSKNEEKFVHLHSKQFIFQSPKKPNVIYISKMVTSLVANIYLSLQKQRLGSYIIRTCFFLYLEILIL